MEITPWASTPTKQASRNLGSLSTNFARNKLVFKRCNVVKKLVVAVEAAAAPIHSNPLFIPAAALAVANHQIPNQP